MGKLTRLAAFATTLFSACAQAQICAPFTDVPASSGFCADIQWMYNRGITTGCTTATTYCPAQFVRRDQMAAFLSRLADNAVFQQGGNAFGATAVLGTTDDRAVEIVVDGERALRVWNVPASASVLGSVNVLGGHSSNVISRTCGVLGCPGDPVRGGTIAGGGRSSSTGENRVTDSWGTIGGGASNTAGNDNSDGFDATFAVVAGGLGNTARSRYGTVGGGVGNDATGEIATVPGGSSNTAAGQGSFAAGVLAHAAADGCFVWSDIGLGGFATTCNTPNLFLARAKGGFALRTNAALTAGCAIAAGGGTWSCSSSRDLKKDIAVVDTANILDRVARLPVSTWRYRDETSGALHLGPTAEDFREAFGLGDSSADIGLIDGQGVALAAIQGLNAKVEAERAAKDAEIAALRAELAAIRSVLATIVPGSPQTAEIAR
jgi:hypothetical protein